MNNTIRAFVAGILSAVSICSVSAQSRISAEVEVKTLAGKSVVTSNKSVYCSGNGRLVVCMHRPLEYMMCTDGRGSTSFYFPKTNEVFVQDGASDSRDELLAVFMIGRIDDLGLGLYGYSLQGSEVLEDGLLKRTYKGSDPNLPPYAEIVFGTDYLPIYSASLSADGIAVDKIYYTHYKNIGYMPFPHRLTQISYTSRTDSTIIRTVYNDVVSDADNEMFDFKVPSDAKPIDLKSLQSKFMGR